MKINKILKRLSKCLKKGTSSFAVVANGVTNTFSSKSTIKFYLGNEVMLIYDQIDGCLDFSVKFSEIEKIFPSR